MPDNSGKSGSTAERSGDIIIRLDVERAVQNLPEEIREVAILFFFQEWKQREIAEQLQITLSLVKYRIGRARELCKRTGGSGGDDEMNLMRKPYEITKNHTGVLYPRRSGKANRRSVPEHIAGAVFAGKMGADFLF